VGKGLQHSSGRVIALGRLILASLFLVAILLDASQPAHWPAATYALLWGYLAFAVMVTVVAWRDWWLDARLAGPAHGVDILLFSALVLLTDGYTSPFFASFMFLLLAAAIRWDWHVTALTAMLLTLLYLGVGMVALTSGVAFDPQRFVVRTGQLVIISLILIWFGANRRWTRFDIRKENSLARPPLDESPFETGLRAAMDSVGAAAGAFVWRDHGRDEFSGLSIDREVVGQVSVAAKDAAKAVETTPFIYDLARQRALKTDADRNLVRFKPGEMVTARASSALALRQGIAIPVATDRGDGVIFLEQVHGLSVDHIEFGAQIAADIANQIQRHTLLRAAEESAEAKSRLILARDLHDSVVQFLAGAAFRLEAMKRSSASGRDFEPEIDELKQLMLQEQRELRTFIKSLRSGPLVAFDALVKDLQALAARLSKQWDVQCEFSAEAADMMIPTRLRLDAQQLTREAVANAVRHAAAKSVSIGLAATASELRLEFINDGAEFRERGGRIELPTSLNERVMQAGGALDMARGMGVTKLSIAIPIGEAGL
jgi:signal transduction histidine kinase